MTDIKIKRFASVNKNISTIDYVLLNQLELIFFGSPKLRGTPSKFTRTIAFTRSLPDIN